jgi:NAD+ synthase (glutamine-hydrolysing)
VQFIAQGNEQVLADARRIGQYGPEEVVDDAQKLANRIFCTAYMGTVNSSAETRSRYDSTSTDQTWYMHNGLKKVQEEDPFISLFAIL